MGQTQTTFPQERYLAPPCSYDVDLPHLTFIREKGTDMIIPLLKIAPRFPKWIMIYSHAQKEDLGVIHDHLVDICESLSIVVLAYDYPTYGMNTRPDFCTEANVTRAMSCVYKYALTEDLLKEKDISKRILLYGNGIGCWVSKWFSQKYTLTVMYSNPPFQTDENITSEDQLEKIIQVARLLFNS